MKLPRNQLLNGCKNPLAIEELLNQAETVLRTKQPIWSDFLSAPLKEEAINIMEPLNNLHLHSDGGHPGAERQRLQYIHYEKERPVTSDSAPITGLRIEGNFLFDRASPTDIRNTLEMMGIKAGALGDIWICGDRGAQALCTPEASLYLNNKTGRVRDVQILCEAVNSKELNLPIQRIPKRLCTVEASRRLDAIASAGFGISRAKIIKQIKEGRLRLNWKGINKVNKTLGVGDRIQLEGKGRLEVLSLELTKRQRWRIELLRQ
ncbi:photosystem II S4 domain protein [Prochlorococcus sp. MIT 1307]|uniref:photosystem II S4 domain protein n=1 Tax=Prochlorococcus sp. MIT 1307 TaxID=3096219 RepID=UPI002A75EB0B|nr:photosystem II S4 domain protein [Prochlorococcus sp. MIT 1307]